ncbi:hypothetical protein MANES_13G013492v8 [Manihot esculenta]|uniref:Uncharacterized protein n=1 Tax=Manihot esculenta TaxID=3983 RepID=A0ACB7GJ28_MANES|nr:hypothetical protein MANES_13G013492v8 [Manihot esculenta]
MHVVSSAKTSAEAWNKIKSSCANRNAMRILSLREKLANLKRENRSVSEYLQTVKAISEDLAIFGSSISEIDLIIHVLNGVGSDFRDIAAAEKLLSHELYLKRINSIDDPEPVVAHNVRKNSNNRQNFSNNCDADLNPSAGDGPFWGRYKEYSSAQNSSRQYSGQTTNKRGSSGSSILCQICELPGHGAKRCFRAKEFFKDNFPQPRANQVTAAKPQNWILDTGASHHVTHDLQNLSIHAPYEGLDELHLTDDTGLRITHVGSKFISFPSKTYSLDNVFCVPHATENSISVSAFCLANNVSIEFFFDCFLVKDLVTGEILTKGRIKDSLYHLSTVPKARSPFAVDSGCRSHKR